MLAECSSELDVLAKYILFINGELRERLHVFSLSENSDLDNMWGCSADYGKGFCIVYDFSKTIDWGFTAMKYLLNSFKVIYSDIPLELSIEAFAYALLFNKDSKNQR